MQVQIPLSHFRCPVAVNDVPCQSVLLKPVNGSRKRRSNHKKSSHDSTSHKIGVKMWKRKKVNSSIHSCGTSISSKCVIQKTCIVICCAVGKCHALNSTCIFI